MSSTYTRSHATDSYQICSSYTKTFDDAEQAVASALVQSQINPSLITNNVFNNVWTYSELDDNSIDTSVLTNYPAGTVTKNSALLMERVDNHFTPTTYSTQLSGNTYTVSNVNATPFCDSKYTMTETHLPSYFDNAVSLNGDTPTGAAVKVTFDNSIPNYPSQLAMNCNWNTVQGPYTDLTVKGVSPTAVSERVSFNETAALGMQGTGAEDYVSYWASPSGNDGSVAFTAISAAYQPNNNNLVVETVDDDEFETFDTTKNVGIFRIQHNAQSCISTTVTLDSNDPVVASSYLTKIPLMDSNKAAIQPSTTKSQVNIPGSMFLDTFKSLFNSAVQDTISDLYQFQINITENAYSGYKINVNDQNVPNQSKRMITQLDNSNLLDNPFYMANYVSQSHAITFSNSDLSVVGATNSVAESAQSFAIDLTNGETLQSNYAGVNGQIKINSQNINSRAKDVVANNISATSSSISVRYSGDAGIGSNSVISNSMMTNPYVYVYDQKVALRSSQESSANVFVSNNGAFITNYAGNQVVNSDFNPENTQFTFDASAFQDDSIRLWRLSSQNTLLVDTNSFYGGYDFANNKATDLIEGITVESVLTNIIGDLTDYDSYRCKLIAKQVSSLGLYTALQSSTNWTIGYSGESDTFLKTNSDVAFNVGDSLPNFDATLIDNIATGVSTLYFKYEYLSGQYASSAGGLQDYINVTYSTNEDLTTDAIMFVIPQSDFTRTFSNDPVQNVVIVDPSLYTLSGIYTTARWQLVKITKSNTFDISFYPKYGPFSNIQVNVNNFVQSNEYYVLQNKLTFAIAAQSALRFVTAPSIPNLTRVTKTLTVSDGTSSITGTFNASDIYGYMAVIEGKQTSDGNWVSISDTVQFDPYHGLRNVNELTIENDSLPTADVTTVCQFSPFSLLSQDSIVVNLTNENYFIPFIYNNDSTTFNVTSFVCAPSDIPLHTNLAQPNRSGYLTVTNNYAATNSGSWSSTAYNVIVSHSNDIHTFTIRDSATSNTVATIVKQKNDIFLGYTIITYIPNDVWRSYVEIGQSQSDANKTVSEEFSATQYIGNAITFSNASGIQLNLASTLDPQGCNIAFKLSGDYMSVNLVGSAIDPTSSQELGLPSHNGGLLAFRFVDSNNNNVYSARVSVSKYRGFPAPNVGVTNVQVYTIQRDATVVTFNVKNGELTQIVSQNMYYDQIMTVNNLINSAQVQCANLGVKFTALYSIPPVGATLNYPVTVTGDNVTISISNPNYTGNQSNIAVPSESTLVKNPSSYNFATTLVSYGQNDIYTFSGIFVTTQSLVAIRPSRIKLRNSEFNHTSLIYKITLTLPAMIIYKAKPQTVNGLNFLGNPELLDDNSSSSIPDDTKWEIVYNLYTVADKIAGVNIGRKHIHQDPTKFILDAVSYFVSLPPMYHFETMAINGNPVLPYNYSNGDYSANKRSKYLFKYQNNQNIFRPFAPSFNLVDINGNSTTITNDSTFVNNFQFEILNSKSVINLAINADNTRNGILICGTVINIVYNFSNGTTTDSRIIYNSPITSLKRVADADVTQDFVVFNNRETNGKINFSALQFPSDVGYVSGLQGYKDVFRTTDKEVYYNINFSIQNPSYHSLSVKQFNVYAAGVRPTLYTVVDVYGPNNKNMRRVYKYRSAGTMTFNSGEGLLTTKTETLTFTQGRQYVDVATNNLQYSTSALGVPYYPNVVKQTAFLQSPGAISWQNDASFTNNVYVSWAYGNSITSNKIGVDLFSVQDNQIKWTFITMLPYQSFVNQFGVTVSEMSWDGSIYSPMVSTQVVNLQQPLADPVLSNDDLNRVEQYSTSTLNNM